LEILSLLVAAVLLAGNIVRLFMASALTAWWAPFVIIAAAFGADLMSGVVHWTADTWGSETCPVFGRRFLRPFRVHHVNPHDFLRRDVVDCNGDVAMINVPMLAGALLIPLASPGGQFAAVALVAFCAVLLPTNQVHQWAHMTSPPRLVRRLQRGGLILSHEEHGRHHMTPYVENYCIATGWCNRGLAAIGFFSALERAVTTVTGFQPRLDEQQFVVGLQSTEQS
jgi:ubiquitin-conjugating enzyme E2 variant